MLLSPKNDGMMGVSVEVKAVNEWLLSGDRPVVTYLNGSGGAIAYSYFYGLKDLNLKAEEITSVTLEVRKGEPEGSYLNYYAHEPVTVELTFEP